MPEHTMGDARGNKTATYFWPDVAEGHKTTGGLRVEIQYQHETLASPSPSAPKFLPILNLFSSHNKPLTHLRATAMPRASV
jgi:hypothetical protein